MATNLEIEIKRAEKMVSAACQDMISTGFKSAEKWMKEIIILESYIREWICILSERKERVVPEELGRAIISFRNSVRIFMELYANNLLFLNGTARIMNKSQISYLQNGTSGTSLKKASFLNIREGV